MFSNRKFLLALFFLSFADGICGRARSGGSWRSRLVVDGNGNPVNPQPTPGINRNRTRSAREDGCDVIRLGRTLGPKPEVHFSRGRARR